MLAAVALLGAAPARGSEGAEANLIRGAYAEGRLWLLSDTGGLFSIAPGSRRRSEQDLFEPVLDLCRQEGVLVAVTGRRGEGAGWTIRRRSRGAWRVIGRAPRRDDSLVAIDCDGGSLSLLTTDRLIEMGPDGPRGIALSEPVIPSRVRTALFGTAEHLYVGLNNGEWGGGLRRIDRASGRVATIERSEGGGACGEPLDAGCDPVHAIAPEPWRPGCVVLAVGLVHFMPNGRLVEVCGERVEQLYSRRSETREGEEAFAGTVAFFGLLRVGDTLRAAGIDGLYRIGPGGAADFTPYPRFSRVAGVLVNFDLPDVVLVVTHVNRRASVSGGAPMLIAR